MFSTIRSRLALNVIIAALTIGVPVLIGLVTNARLTQSKKNMQQGMANAEFFATAAGLGDRLYVIIADTQINRELKETLAAWEKAKGEAALQLSDGKKRIDGSNEQKHLEDAATAYDEVVDLYEKGIRPMIQIALTNRKRDFTAELRGMDSLVDDSIGRISVNLVELRNHAHARAEAASDEYNAIDRRSSSLVLGSSLVGLLLMVAFSLWLMRLVVKPIQGVAARAADMAQGEGDLTRTLPERGAGEMAELARHFNAFVRKIRAMVGLTRESVAASQDSSRRIAEQVNANAQSVEQVSGAILEARKSTKTQHERVAAVDRLATEQASQIERLLADLRTVGQRVEDLGRVVSHQAASVTEMGATIEEQAANIRNIAQVAQKADTAGQSLAHISAEGKSLLAKTAEAMNRMIETTHTVADFANIITGIAGQTNLLAMNAAIEAAHAGEAGKGFAVVADEIRKLADQSNTEAGKVKNLLREIEAVTEGAGGQLQNTAASFDRIVGETQTVSEVVRQVRNAMEEQNSANTEMVKAIGEIQITTEKVKGSGEGILEANRSMNQAASSLVEKTGDVQQALMELRKLTDVIVRTVDAVEAGLAGIQKGTQAVREQAGSQAAQMEGLAAQVARFRIDSKDANPAKALPERNPAGSTAAQEGRSAGLEAGVSEDEIRGLTLK